MNKQEITILVVDDDREICRAIAKLLELEGYQTLKAYDGIEALEYVKSHKIQLMILDVMMPRLDGLSATMKLRQERNVPIIILSAKSEDSDKILGLSMGADDYITKPFNPKELIARVNSQLRRYIMLGTIDTNNAAVIVNGGMVFNQNEKSLYVDDEPIKLTPIEYKIVELLLTNLGIVFSAEKIYQRVWQEDCYQVENTVMVHIRRIREKIEINPKEPEYLKVVWGIGYKIEKKS